MPGPVVFISYSHDSDEHRERVLGLAARLRKDGLEIRLDQTVNGTPEQGWPRWMLDQLDDAAFVLVVCTETYYRRFRGHDEPDRGKGADWEGVLITQGIYDKKSRTTKFVPVMLSGSQEDYIPEPLRAHTHYELTSAERYQALYTFLLGQAGVDLGPPGAIKPKSRRTAEPLAFGSSAATQTIMIGVPHHNPFFTGREELLARLHYQLQNTNTTELVQAALYGLGGIGKTQTAIEYVRRFGKSYRFVLWVVAEEEVTIREAYLSIARDLGLVNAQTDFEGSIRAVKAWLSRKSGWLLVFDNADEPTLVRPYLPQTREGGQVLLTSRANSFVMVGIQEPILVETLDSQEAVHFLLKRTRDTKANSAAELAEALGNLPLALEQAAAYIETVGGSCTQYLERYERQGATLLAKSKPSTEYQRTVESTWAINLQAVKETSKASSELLIAAAFLAPDSIPMEIFTRGGAALSKHPPNWIGRFLTFVVKLFSGLNFNIANSLGKALVAASTDELVFWELLEPLEHYSLVQRLPGNAFKLHRMTQQMIRASLPEDGQKVWLFWLTGALNLAYPDFEVTNWRACERLQPHVLQSLNLFKKVNFSNKAHLLLLRLLQEAGRFAQDRGDLDGAWNIQVQALQIAAQPIVPYTVTTRLADDLASTVEGLGYYAKAKWLREQVAGLLERRLGPHHPDTLESKRRLASTLGSLGDLATAREILKQNLEHLERNLARLERKLGPEHPSTLESRRRLALGFGSLGDLSSAKKLHEQNLENQERVLGSEHPETMMSRGLLAEALRNLRDYEGARRLHEQNLEIYQRVSGIEHPNVLATRAKLALTILSTKDYINTRRLQEQNLEIYERVYGIEHSESLASRRELAITLTILRDQAGARNLLEHNVKIYERMRGNEHPETLAAKSSLALTLYALGCWEDAKSIFEGILEIRERVLGAEHPSTTGTTWDLLRTGRQLKDSQAEAQLISKLRWLLDRDEDSIPSALQREIRQKLLDFLNPA